VNAENSLSLFFFSSTLGDFLCHRCGEIHFKSSKQLVSTRCQSTLSELSMQSKKTSQVNGGKADSDSLPSNSWGLVMPSQNASSVSLAAPANDLAAFLTVAKEVGLFIILRPGPYINAETTGGGMPGWVQNLDTQLRVQNDTWNAAWQPYMKAIIDAALPFQVKAASNSSDGTIDTSGGTLLAVQVENEFQQTGPMEAYFDDIIQFYKDNGITVPTTFNALSGGTEYSNNTVVNIWGQDSYP
jgi:hypothetical protein